MVVKAVQTPGAEEKYILASFFPTPHVSSLRFFVDEGRRKRQRINGDGGDILVAHLLSPSVWDVSAALTEARHSLLVFPQGWNKEGFWICRWLSKVAFLPRSPLEVLFSSLLFCHPSFLSVSLFCGSKEHLSLRLVVLSHAFMLWFALFLSWEFDENDTNILASSLLAF